MHSNFPLSRRSTRMRLAVLLSVLTSAACIAGAEAQDPAPDSASMRPRQRPASDAPATPAQPRLTAAQVAGLVQSFYDQTTSFQANRMAVAGFLAGVVSFLLALVCFLTETVIATRLLNFPLLNEGAAP